MARTLLSSVRDLFNGGTAYGSGYNVNTEDSIVVKYMEIPLHGDVFEVPILALIAFEDSLDRLTGASPDAMVIKLNTDHRVSIYKSLERNMRDILIDPFVEHRLIPIKVPEGDRTIIYYGTQGAIFKEDLTPMMLCSYLIERVAVDGGVKYKILKPVLRITPTVYMHRTLPMEKFIINKMLPACLEDVVELPYNNLFSRGLFLPFDRSREIVKVEIDTFPFVVRQSDTPSISTTNQQLLQLAIDHIDELTR